MAKIVNNTLEVRDIPAELKAGVNVVNELTKSLKNRNLVGVKRDELVKARRDSLKNLIFLTSAGIVNEMIDSDFYGFLTAQVSNKHFKEVADINHIIRGLLDELVKIPAEGNEAFSVIEIARMVENPYQYRYEEQSDEYQYVPLECEYSSESEEYENGVSSTADSVPEVDGVNVIEVTDTCGNGVVVDKVNATMYVSGDGEHPSTTDKPVEKFSFRARAKSCFDTMKNILCSLWGTVWSSLVSFCSMIIAGICFIGSSLYAGGVWIIDKITSPFRKKEDTDKKDTVEEAS